MSLSLSFTLSSVSQQFDSLKFNHVVEKEKYISTFTNKRQNNSVQRMAVNKQKMPGKIRA